MSNPYRIAVYEVFGESHEVESNHLIADRLKNDFEIISVEDEASCLDVAKKEDVKSIILNYHREDHLSYELCSSLRNSFGDDVVPVLVVASYPELDEKIKAFEQGCDDCLTYDLNDEELVARVNKSIFNKIANDQMKSSLKIANETAFSAMSTTADLGVNIQFLLATSQCNNLDELGQLLFRSLASYDIHCSLQMRMEGQVKNMEPNGLTKELESQLLSELKTKGRYFDFGCRCVMNYDRVSLLVKDMPMDDSQRYGALKDNVFSLLQGADIRIDAMENEHALQSERDAMETLAKRVEAMIETTDAKYQGLVRRCAEIVEELYVSMEEKFVSMDLIEEQELILQASVQACVEESNKLFSEGLKIDETFSSIIKQINYAFDEPDQSKKAKLIKSLLNTL